MQTSPFTDDRARVQLHVAAGSPLAEVFLIDHAFALVDRSVGDLHANVEQGVYKVKARLGGATTEQLVVLNGDQRIDLSGDLPIASAAPLEGTSRTHEFHMDPAGTESSSVAVKAGRGAQIFLVARRWSSETPAAAHSEPSPPPQLSLHRPDGKAIVDLGGSGGSDPTRWDPMVGTTVEVDPGGYVLRWCDDSGHTAEQSVQAVRDWQTQVFLLEDAGDPPATTRQAVSVLMSQEGFRPDDGMLRAVEEARSALGDERKVASQSINESLFAKFDNPMLGLFGAHLMLLARDALLEAEEDRGRQTSDAKRVRAPVSFDQGLFDNVVANLRNLLGRDHPDVVALATKATNQPLDELDPVTVPPMLWRSWVLLIEASNSRPALVPVATWQRALKLLPLRPFLVWSPEEDSAETVREWQREVGRTLRGSVRADEAARRRLSLQLLAPRAAIDELVAAPA